ncbi:MULTISPECIES: SRPBCC family protein [Streptomyces]|uniref:SRPBCC family protein n=1 Tax=Streptomyces TaxID=1883 RepID=UPI00200D8CDC|nr:SRPBCC family protein [Streptomyces sp. LRE541]UPZ27088.1 SRPBCC family protein [Streptomyces sp. LRE541]
MAVRHRLIKKSPREVWAVLADGTRYADWVVGTASSYPVRGQWPQVHSAIGYEVRVGLWTVGNESVVRACVEERELELEAIAGPLGTARIAIELRPWGEYTLVIIDEHPLQGVGGVLHNAAAEGLIQLRHRAMLKRLADVCEGDAQNGSRPARTQPRPA